MGFVVPAGGSRGASVLDSGHASRYIHIDIAGEAS